MGTVLSFSPKNNHYDDQLPSVKEEKSIKKHGIFFNGLSWKKLSSINHHTNNQYPTQQAFKGTYALWVFLLNSALYMATTMTDLKRFQ